MYTSFIVSYLKDIPKKKFQCTTKCIQLLPDLKDVRTKVHYKTKYIGLYNTMFKRYIDKNSQANIKVNRPHNRYVYLNIRL